MDDQAVNAAPRTEGLNVKGTVLEIFRSKGIGKAVEADLDCTDGLVKYIEQAQKSIVFAIFSLTSQPIADALLAANKRGVAMYGLADSKQWSNHTAVNSQLVDAGIDLEKAVRQHACMHLKVAVIDEQLCALGSFNWTNNAEQHNDEVLVVIDSAEAAAVIMEQIDEARKLNHVDALEGVHEDATDAS